MQIRVSDGRTAKMDPLTPETTVKRFEQRRTLLSFFLGICALLTLWLTLSESGPLWLFVAVIAANLTLGAMLVREIYRLRATDLPPPRSSSELSLRHHRRGRVFGSLAVLSALAGATLVASVGTVMHWGVALLLFLFLWFAIIAAMHLRSARSLRNAP